MPVLNFSYARIKDAGKFQEYIAKAAVLLKEAGAEVLVRANFAETLRGNEQQPHIAAVFRFADMQAAKGFYESEAYKEILALRDEACDMSVHLYEEK